MRGPMLEGQGAYMMIVGSWIISTNIHELN